MPFESLKTFNYHILSNSDREIFGIKISVSKASLVSTQLNQPVSLDSNTCTISLFGGRERMTFDISFLMQPLKALAELHFRGMNQQILCIVLDQFSKILNRRQVSWKLYKSFLSDKLPIFSVKYRNLFRFVIFFISNNILF